MNQAAVSIAKNLINLIYPLRCASCKGALDSTNEYGVCGFCLAEIKRNPKPCYMEREGRMAYSACLYEGPLKEIIHSFKYKKRISLAKIVSKFMIDFISENGEVLEGIDIITFVPLKNDRLRERGFNQSKVLAFNISKEFGIPLLDALQKTRATRPQNELSRDERLANLDGAFKVKGDVELNNARMLLIDDVMTTGATLSECSKILLDAGALEVRCLALARGI